MEYRKLPHGEEQISVIGMGSSVVGELKDAEKNLCFRFISEPTM